MDRSEQLMRDGTPVGRFHRYDAAPPSAELFEVLVSLESAVEQILTDLPGWNLTTTDEVLADALVERGAVPTRHYSLMTIDLSAQASWMHIAPSNAAYDIRPLSPDAEIPDEVIGLVRSAYPLGHPDEEIGSDGAILADIRHALAGRRLGPLMDSSALVFDGGRPVGLVLVNRVPGAAPTGGPWITDVCRDPDPRYAGLGRTLIVRALSICRAAGESSVSLAVTQGNIASQIYDALGFALVATTRKVRLPG
ncbi:MAG: GNAT family N-acetyltransferase [Actinomycetia bacterium]|nr:GNAT family N-acetyltransferase [Actinomycetes bacterium]